MLSVIIPSRNEIYLEKTIRNVLENADGEIEIIAILDGWLPDPQINIGDERVRFVHFKESIGQRQSINYGAKIAKGDYVMKLDAHCAVDKGFDVILARDCEYNMTMIPRMYNLDVLTWKPKLHKRTDYMFFSSPTAEKPFRAMYYGKDQPKNDKMIDDIMCCMGPAFFMHKKRFWELEGCDVGHGGWGQQGIEVSLKAWLSGGRLVVNKNTWFAHWFRGGGVPAGHKAGFPYHITNGDVERARKYSQDLWLNDKWHLAKRKLQWVIDKFNPPTWEDYYKNKSMDQRAYYNYMIKNHRMPRWRGTKIVKYPSDLMLYQQAISENKPDVIVETGTYKGGSALFFADMMELNGHGEVITIDIKDHNPPKHPRITHLIGRATSTEILDKVREMTAGKKVMVVLDSNHHRAHVKRELVKYKDIVSVGQYMVVEDTNYKQIGKKNGPDEAVEWFMKKTKNFQIDPVEEQFYYSLCPRGWLKKLQ